MKKITIYAKDENNIERFDVFIYKKYLLKLLQNLDNYYGVQTEIKDYFGRLPEYKENEFYEPVAIKVIKYDIEHNLYIHTIKHIKAVGLSKIVREILNNDYLKASYAINELFNYTYKDEEEKMLLEEVKSCFHFEKSNKKIDLRRYSLNIEKGLLEKLEEIKKIDAKVSELETLDVKEDYNIKYVDDKIESRTDNLPDAYAFKLKHE